MRRRQPTTLWDRIKAGVLFILTGSVPGAVQAIASMPPWRTHDGRVLRRIRLWVWTLGYFLPQRSWRLTFSLPHCRFGFAPGSGRPTPVEVFAFRDEVRSAEGVRVVHLERGNLSVSV